MKIPASFDSLKSPFTPASFFYVPVKRGIDIVFALLFLICVSPLYFIVAVLIFLQDRHWPFYTQIRVGRNKKEFRFYKFRSMVTNADAILFSDKKLYEQMRSGVNKVVDDPRITKIGKFIRKYSIDEFPQMLNILFGQMSVVGPRPLRPDEMKLFEDKSADHKKIIEIVTTMKPGLTGMWQVHGRSHIPFDERMKLECWYAKTPSVLTDLRIMLKTPYAILKGEGAY